MNQISFQGQQYVHSVDPNSNQQKVEQKENDSKNNNKKLNYIILFAISFLQSASVSIIVPFFPPLTKKKGTPLLIKGLVLGINPIGNFLYSCISSKMLKFLGQQQVFCLGIIIQSISLSTFGALHQIDDADFFFVFICIFSRLIQGFSRAAVNSAFPAYISQIYPQKIQTLISQLDRVATLGILIGPAIGQVLYSFIGDFLPFYIISAIFLFSLIFIKYLPGNEKVNNSIDSTMYFKYLSDKMILATFLISIGVSTAQSFITPLYAIHIQGLGLTEHYIGYFYTLSTVFYIILLFLFPIIQSYINRQIFLTVGLLLSLIGIEFQAPESYIENLFGFSLNQWYIVTIGQCITNISSSMCLLPMVPELNQLIIDKEVFENQICLIDKQLKKKCIAMASRIFILGSSLGSFIGPFSVGILYQKFNGSELNKYMNTSRCIAGFLFIVFILYLIMGKCFQGISQQINGIKNFVSNQQSSNDTINNKTNQNLIIYQEKYDQSFINQGQIVIQYNNNERDIEAQHKTQN
ncbi:hypothetical protein ABPG74_021795 [Tetrahymena malaccensis]